MCHPSLEISHTTGYCPRNRVSDVDHALESIAAPAIGLKQRAKSSGSAVHSTGGIVLRPR
jgi:hypothetical protein